MIFILSSNHLLLVEFLLQGILEALTNKEIDIFKRKIYAHYKKYGRDFPWRRTTNAYRIMVSEIMLQQTQADRVVPKYREFIKKFPTVQMLDKASLRDVLKVWQGLGYNRRAKMLYETAKVTMIYHNGRLPKHYEELIMLPGIGDYTARAVRVFAHNEPEIMIETNIRTVFIHFFFKKQKKAKDSELLPLIETTLDRKHSREWYSALMDYGSMLKKEYPNPNRKSAHHTKQSTFKGSNRQIRGAIIKALVNHKKLDEKQLVKMVQKNQKRTQEQLQKLIKEGFIQKQKNTYTFA